MARRMLGENVTQIDTTSERVKRMVGKVLTGNGSTRFGNGAYALIGGDELSDRGNVSGRERGSGAIKRKQRY